MRECLLIQAQATVMHGDEIALSIAIAAPSLV